MSRSQRPLTGKLIRLALAAAAATAATVLTVLLLPVTLIAAVAVTAAWRQGWRPARLYRAAAWCLPMVAVWLVTIALTGHSLWPAADTARLAWQAVWRHGDYLRAAVLVAPAAVPVGLVVGGWAWSRRIAAMAARTGGQSPAAAVGFDRRQWRHQVRAALARIAAPGSVPLLTASGDFVAGAVIRTVGHPDGTLTRLPADRLRAHQVVIGGTGTGKSTLLLRLWAGFLAVGLSRHASGLGGPPLLVVLDCKGGADARRLADRTRRVLRDAGARTVAVWPDETRLSLWSLPPRQLVTTLADLIEHGTGGAAYYTDVLEAVVTLAVEAPDGPPASTSDFLARLDPGWLQLAHAGSPERLALARSAARQVSDVALRYRALFRRLGPGLDGPGVLDDADAWYCILEGTAEVAVAEAQARALVDLLASYVTGQAGRGRPVLLAVDEFSAVARRLPIWQLYERARSLGLAVQVSAQSWHGLAARDDDRYRIAASAEGGIWLLRTPHPDPVIALAGRQFAVDTTRQLTGRLRWSRSGHSRLHRVPVTDPDLIRSLDVGQAAYIFRGGVTFTQVKRLVAGPAALGGVVVKRTGAPAHPAPPSRAEHPADPAMRPAEPATTGLPDITALLDEAFGSRP
jgi:hypothetical protein